MFAIDVFNRREGEWLPVALLCFAAEESPPTVWTCERRKPHDESHGSGTETIRPPVNDYEVVNRRRWRDTMKRRILTGAS